jgi:Fe-S cluster assembly iron-binding protein IscA
VGAALDGSQNQDVVFKIKDIEVEIDPVIEPFMKDAIIDINEIFFMKQLSVRSKIGTC